MGPRLFRSAVILFCKLKVMKTKFNYPFMIFACLALIVFSSSCNKENENLHTSFTYHLTNSDWQLSCLDVSPGIDAQNGEHITDLYANLDKCYKDNSWDFEDNGSCFISEGQYRCNEDNPAVDTTAWHFNAEGTALILDGKTYSIYELGPNSLILNWKETKSSVVYTYTMGFSH